jgi:hypothetical protein
MDQCQCSSGGLREGCSAYNGFITRAAWVFVSGVDSVRGTSRSPMKLPLQSKSAKTSQPEAISADLARPTPLLARVLMLARESNGKFAKSPRYSPDGVSIVTMGARGGRAWRLWRRCRPAVFAKLNPKANPRYVRPRRIIKYLAVPNSLVSCCEYLMSPR